MTKLEEIENRVEDLLDSDINGYFHSIVSDTPNPHKYLRDLIQLKDQDSEVRSKLSDLEEARRVFEDSLVIKEELADVDKMKADRNRILLETDYTQLPDSPYSTAEKTEYREYRQYLRDLPSLYENKQILEPIALSFADWKLNKPVY